jgi:hypothetical protein
MHDALYSVMSYDVSLVNPPDHCNIVALKWALTYKSNELAEIGRRKSRLDAQSYAQKPEDRERLT